MSGASTQRTPGQFFADHPEGLRIYGAVEDVIVGLGAVDVTVSKSQISFRRRTGFAFVWRPGQYVASEVPAVLSIALDHELASSRFKSVVHPSPGVWMHHLELRAPEEVDDDVFRWLQEAYQHAA